MLRTDVPRVLVAELPPMTSTDLRRFESEGGIWGKQRAIRRQQVSLILGAAATFTLGGLGYSAIVRKNTWLASGGTALVWTLCGGLLGNAAAQNFYPSVADNKETTMMRRTWWAKECSKQWDLSQVTEDRWRAVHPKSALAVGQHHNAASPAH